LKAADTPRNLKLISKISLSCEYWFQLLQILQKYGAIDHFNFVYHTKGPNVGDPKGFAFIKYKDVSFAILFYNLFKIIALDTG
jgi:hypothetical protein